MPRQANFRKVPSIWWVYLEFSFLLHSFGKIGALYGLSYDEMLWTCCYAAVCVNFVMGPAGFWCDNIQNVWLVMLWDGELWAILTYIHLADPNAVAVFDTSTVPAATKVIMLLLKKSIDVRKKCFIFDFSDCYVIILMLSPKRKYYINIFWATQLSSLQMTTNTNMKTNVPVLFDKFKFLHRNRQRLELFRKRTVLSS